MQDFISVKQFTNFAKERYSERIAYRFLRDGMVQELTYGAFLGKADGITNYFSEHGIRRKPIAIIGKTSYEWASTYIGVLNSNNIVVLMDPNLMLEQKEAILNQIDAEYVFTDESYMEQKENIRKHCKTVKEVYSLPVFVQAVKAPVSVPDIEVNPEDLGQYMFTSGTTGQSKAVMLSYRNVASTIGFKNVTPLQDGDVVLSVLPIHHCFELTSSHFAVFVIGGTTCINDAMDHMMENIKRFQPTVMFVVPAIMEELLREFKRQVNEEFVGRLRVIATGGAKMRSELPSEFWALGIKVAYGFGMTEMCGHTVLNMNTLEKPESVGIPSVNHLKIKIAEDGEILLKGPNTMMGYYNLDNSSYFTEDKFLRTGDLGELDEDGYLSITGRKKNVIILNNGENVYPEELEAYLVTMPEVRQAVVFEWNGQIAAMIYPKDKEFVTQIESQIQELNRKVATYKRITKIFYRDTPFPSTPSGKIKRKEFLDEIKPLAVTEYVPPKTKMEKWIADIVEEVLGLQKKAGREDDFFALGGNSLSVLAVAAKINVNAQYIYENPVIKNLAEALEAKGQEKEQDESYINTLINEQKSISSAKDIKNVLLTGATGFLGVHLLHELVKKEVPRVNCLVRDKEKIKKVYKRYFREELPENVKLVAGDITKERLGLDKADYEKLAGQTDNVIHAAANVHHIGKREEFMKTNYQGTEHMIELCKSADATLHFISSYVSSGIGVVPIHSDVKAFSENMLYIGQDYKQNVYVHTKYLSEVKIIEEREKGLKANIYRVGSLTSRRKDGIFQINKTENGLRNRLNGLLKTGVYTEEMEEFPIDFTPVDDCAEALVKLVCAGKVNRIYHMFNPYTIRLKDFGKICGITLKNVTRESFEHILDKKLSDKEISEYAFYNALSCSSEAIPMECEKTVQALKNVSFEWNQNQVEYIRNFVK